MTVNKAILIGRLGKDPEIRYMTNGEAVANVSLATSENYKDKSGEKQERTEWHHLTMYRRLAEIAGEYLKKGALIYVEGRIQTSKWQDKTGQDRYTTEIIVNEMKMLGSKQSDNTTDHSAADAGHTAMEKPAGETYTKGGLRVDAPSANDFPDDIPFMESCRHYGLWRTM